MFWPVCFLSFRQKLEHYLNAIKYELHFVWTGPIFFEKYYARVSIQPKHFHLKINKNTWDLFIYLQPNLYYAKHARFWELRTSRFHHWTQRHRHNCMAMCTHKSAAVTEWWNQKIVARRTIYQRTPYQCIKICAMEISSKLNVLKFNLSTKAKK